LFRYEVQLANWSRYGLDDFSIVISRPTGGVVLVEPPNVTTTPKDLIKVMRLTQTAEKSGLRVGVDLLNPGQSISITYLGYSQPKLHAIGRGAGPFRRKATKAERDAIKRAAAKRPQALPAPPLGAHRSVTLVRRKTRRSDAFFVSSLRLGLHSPSRMVGGPNDNTTQVARSTPLPNARHCW